MKPRNLLLFGMAVVLAGCGHGFEGEYAAQSGSSIEILNAVAKAVGDKTIVIGSNYIDSDGKRTNYEEIFVRESGSQSYLVLKKDKDTEEVWKIVDKDTLIQGGGLVSVTLKRVNK